MSWIEHSGFNIGSKKQNKRESYKQENLILFLSHMQGDVRTEFKDAESHTYLFEEARKKPFLRLLTYQSSSDIT